MGHKIILKKKHISELKAKCNKGLNLVRSICSHEWGADQHALMIIYRTLIRIKLDYGSIVYDSAALQDLKALQTTANRAMTIASGCFKSTPITSLQVITTDPPLQQRRDKL